MIYIYDIYIYMIYIYINKYIYIYIYHVYIYIDLQKWFTAQKPIWMVKIQWRLLLPLRGFPRTTICEEILACVHNLGHGWPWSVFCLSSWIHTIQPDHLKPVWGVNFCKIPTPSVVWRYLYIHICVFSISDISVFNLARNFYSHQATRYKNDTPSRSGQTYPRLPSCSQTWQWQKYPI